MEIVLNTTPAEFNVLMYGAGVAACAWFATILARSF